MNFFKLYIGDYQRDTAHLSVTEHGAFLLMLQHYYATEKPLPKGKALHRMLRAQDKAEREAIDTVAAQFWTETDAGLINERADDEITKAHIQADTNARIAREREAKRKAAREEHDTSTNRATNDEPNHSHNHSQLNTSLSGADDRLEIPGLTDYHPADWQPDHAKLAAVLLRSGIPMPQPEVLALAVDKFNLTFTGKPMTPEATYERLRIWLAEDRIREQQRTQSRGSSAPSGDKATRKLTAAEQIEQDCRAGIAALRSGG